MGLVDEDGLKAMVPEEDGLLSMPRRRGRLSLGDRRVIGIKVCLLSSGALSLGKGRFWDWRKACRSRSCAEGRGSVKVVDKVGEFDRDVDRGEEEVVWGVDAMRGAVGWVE